jgi:hypothetical protein
MLLLEKSCTNIPQCHAFATTVAHLPADGQGLLEVVQRLRLLTQAIIGLDPEKCGG